jgi:hypothetical protein
VVPGEVGMTLEECPWTTWVYGLTYPEPTGLFYVGVSVTPYTRFSAHWAATGECSSYNVISLWKPKGWKFGHILFGEYESRIDAMRLERALITTIPCLANSKSGGAMLSTYRYPVCDLDAILMQEALERAGMVSSDDEIDRSGEYVDERYDELDYVDGP